MRLRDANVQDAPAIADLWNPIIRDTLNTFTTEEKPSLRLKQQFLLQAWKTVGILSPRMRLVCWGFAPIFSFAGDQAIAIRWSIALFWPQGRCAKGSGVS